MFRFISIPLVIVAMMWASGWVSGHFEFGLPFLSHLIYFVLVGCSVLGFGPPFFSWLGALIIGVASFVMLWHPITGGLLLAMLVLGAVAIDLYSWWISPRPGLSAYDDPRLGTCTVENASPQRLHNLRKEARSF